MPTPTDNHNLDVGYVEGESWDYNDEFQTIEERLVVRDTEANLSNYTPHSAATFIATDTGAVYDGDGTNWNAATRSYNAVNTTTSPYANVMAYGAVGDGVADDTQAIKDARDGVSAGDIVFFPPGDYLVTGAINRQGRIFVGAHRFSATVVADTGGSWGTGGHANATAILYDRNQDNAGTYNLGVDGNGEDAAGISSFGGSYVSFTHNYVRNTTDCGIQFWGNDATGEAENRHGQIANNIVHECRWPLVLDGACTNCEVVDNVSYIARSRHISCDFRQTADDIDARGNLASGNVLRGYEGTDMVGAIGALDNANNTGFIQISDNYLYDWTGDYGINMACGGTVKDNVLHGDFPDEIPIGIHLDGASATISDNDIYVAVTGIKTVNSPPDPSFFNNRFNTISGSDFDISGYGSDWSFDGNYNDGVRVDPTFDKGYASVPSGSTSGSFSITMPGSPVKSDVSVTPATSLGSATQFWVSSVSSTSITISLDQDPAQSVEFAVKVEI